MGQRAPSAGQIADRGRVRVLVLRSAALPLERLRRAGPVQARRATGSRSRSNEATQLAVESDVRISNVSVGKVKEIELEDEGENRDLALATIEVDEPLRADARGHPGDPAPEDAARRDVRGADSGRHGRARRVPEGGSLPRAQVSDAVQLDEIFRTFDERTRAAFRVWMQQLGARDGGAGRRPLRRDREPGALRRGHEPPAARARHPGAGRLALRPNTGVVFSALSRAPGPAPRA